MTMMSELIPSHELGRLKQALFLGLARQPLAVPEGLQALLAAAPGEPSLAVLALAAQRLRFERPAVTRGADGVPEVARWLHEDSRPIIPEPVRRLLLRLANGAEKHMADTVVRAAVRRVLRAGFRLHPFDLPKLIGFIKGDAQCLGLAERAYLALADAQGKADAPSLMHAEITAENWTEHPKGNRVAFLCEQRRKDPAAARALLEGVFKSETAAVRADLLAALGVGLGPDDLPFLESITSDRSEAVRALAARLIANVPGTAAYTSRLAEAAQCFARRAPASGILKSIGLASAGDVAFTPPKAAGKGKQLTELDRQLLRFGMERLFDGFSLAEVAAAAALTADEVLAALSNTAAEDNILTAFTERATRDSDEETLVRLARHQLTDPLSLETVLGDLALSLSGSAPLEFGRLLLEAPAWHAVLKERQEATTPAAMKDDGTLIWTAAILPPELHPAFETAIAALPPVATRSARDFSDLMLALDALQPPQR
jgi:hypothetical protein